MHVLAIGFCLLLAAEPPPQPEITRPLPVHLWGPGVELELTLVEDKPQGRWVQMGASAPLEEINLQIDQNSYQSEYTIGEDHKAHPSKLSVKYRLEFAVDRCKLEPCPSGAAALPQRKVFSVARESDYAQNPPAHRIRAESETDTFGDAPLALTGVTAPDGSWKAAPPPPGKTPKKKHH